MTDPVSPELVIVGSAALDTVITPGGRRGDVLGGSVSYACIAAAYRTRVGMVGVVGTDFPDRFVRLFKKARVDVAGLQRVSGRTFRWTGEYESDMNNRRTLSTELNVFGSFRPELPESYRSAPFVFLGNISPGLQMHVLSQVIRPKFITVDTMDLWIRTDRKTLMQVIKRVDLLTVNDSEARLLTGEHNVVVAARKMIEYGPRYVVVKKGEHGAMLFSPSGVSFVPAYPVEDVRDPTGAGDTFAGGFMGYLAGLGRTDVNSVRRAMLYGSVLASFGVEAFSVDRLASLKKSDISGRLGRIQKMMRLPG